MIFLKKHTKGLFLLVAQFLFFSIPSAIYADSFKINQNGLGVKSSFGSTPFAESVVQTIILNVISLFFTIGGISAIIYFIWGAVDWILSGGDKEKIAGARKKMTNALIGLALLSLSFVIINWVGLIVGFNPLGILQLRNLGDTSPLPINQ